MDEIDQNKGYQTEIEEMQSKVTIIGKNREVSSSSKKELAKMTKEFRQSNSVDLSSFKTLLKAYQREIDALSQRCGESDAFYIDLFEKMKDREASRLHQSGAGDDSGDLEATKIELDRVIGEGEGMMAEIVSLKASREEITATARTEIERLIGVRDELVIDNDKLKRKMKEILVDTGKEKDEEIARLQREVLEYEEEFKGLKDQDLTIKQLQKQIKQQNEQYNVGIEKRIKEGIKDGLNEWDEKINEVMDREAEWMRKCEALELALRAERAGRQASDSNLVTGIQNQGDREETFEQQKKILLGETERLMEELYVVGRERDELKLKLEEVGKAAADVADPAGTTLGVNFENERTALMNEIAEANGTLQQVRKEGKIREEELEVNAKGLKLELDVVRKRERDVSEELESVKGELRLLPSKEEVERMRKELKILKQVNFNENGEDGEGSEDRGVESVLVKRLRKVEGDLIGVQRESNEKDTELERLLEGTKTLEEENEKLVKLVERLEVDVVALQKGMATGSLGGEGNVLRSILEKESVPRATPVKIAPSSPQGVIGLGGSGTVSPGNQMTAILMAQRDRLQEKVSLIIHCSTPPTCKSNRNAHKSLVRFISPLPFAPLPSPGFQSRANKRQLEEGTHQCAEEKRERRSSESKALRAPSICWCKRRRDNRYWGRQGPGGGLREEARPLQRIRSERKEEEACKIRSGRNDCLHGRKISPRKQDGEEWTCHLLPVIALPHLHYNIPLGSRKKLRWPGSPTP